MQNYSSNSQNISSQINIIREIVILLQSIIDDLIMQFNLSLKQNYANPATELLYSQKMQIIIYIMECLIDCSSGSQENKDLICQHQSLFTSIKQYTKLLLTKSSTFVNLSMKKQGSKHKAGKNLQQVYNLDQQNQGYQLKQKSYSSKHKSNHEKNILITFFDFFINLMIKNKNINYLKVYFEELDYNMLLRIINQLYIDNIKNIEQIMKISELEDMSLDFNYAY